MSTGKQVANLTPIGTKNKGEVVLLSRELGFGYIQKSGTLKKFFFSKESHPEHFDSFEKGSEVHFFENGHGCVAQFIEP